LLVFAYRKDRNGLEVREICLVFGVCLRVIENTFLGKINENKRKFIENFGLETFHFGDSKEIIGNYQIIDAWNFLVFVHFNKIEFDLECKIMNVKQEN